MQLFQDFHPFLIPLVDHYENDGYGDDDDGGGGAGLFD